MTQELPLGCGGGERVDEGVDTGPPSSILPAPSPTVPTAPVSTPSSTRSTPPTSSPSSSCPRCSSSSLCPRCSSPSSSCPSSNSSRSSTKTFSSLSLRPLVISSLLANFNSTDLRPASTSTSPRSYQRL